MLTPRQAQPSLIGMAVLVFLAFSRPAYAYIGPGAGLTAIGSFVALILAVVVAIFGFLWYPVKRMLKKRKSRNQDAE